MTTTAQRDFVIQVRGLGKLYEIGEKRKCYKTLRESLVGALRSSLGRNSHASHTFWALKDVGFQVQRGEIVGIIGRNGSGKSTLLKILSRITDLTEGEVEIDGCVGSLLEVGTGFHPELTGRENIFLNGAILGMKRHEINNKFDEIVGFAEIEKFLDTPVKHYSSGMYMRLAFAIAAHLEPEILIVDEVLAVGDAEFQKKCLGKMKEISSSGRTILFVSHNMTAIQALCSRVIWLDRGSIRQNGQPAAVIPRYFDDSAPSRGETFWPNLANAPGNETVRIRKAAVRPADCQPTDLSARSITVRSPLILDFEYWVLRESCLSLSLHVFNEDGIRAFNTFPRDEARPLPVGLFRSYCYIPGDLLNDGSYSVQLLAVLNQCEVIFTLENAVTFRVMDARAGNVRWHGKILGTIRPMLEWTTEIVEESELTPEPNVAAD